MHERTQRAISRLMFVFCCAVPTAITVLCLVVTWTPWYHHRVRRSIEAELSLQSGLVITIDDFQRPSPSTLRLYGVRAVEPETRREVATVRVIERVEHDQRIAILLQQPKIQSRELSSAWRLIHDRFLCRPEQVGLPIRIAANDLTIDSYSGALTLSDLDAWIRSDEDSVEATVECLLASSKPDAPISISVRRDRSGDQPVTQWTLDTRGTPLPCSAVAEYITLMDVLGSNAMFSGTMRWQTSTDKWWVDLGGSSFTEVSLDRLFERSLHRLSGTASIEFKRCRIEPHLRRSDIAGSIVAKEGRVGRSLLISSHEHFGFDLRMPEHLIETGDNIPYDRLAIGFNINNTRMELDGICRTLEGYAGFPAGVALCLDGYPIVYSSGQELNSLKVIAAIAPSHSVLIPMSDQTRWLTQVFIPPSRPLPQEGQFPPRIRSAENWRGGPTITQPPR